MVIKNDFWNDFVSLGTYYWTMCYECDTLIILYYSHLPKLNQISITTSWKLLHPLKTLPQNPHTTLFIAFVILFNNPRVFPIGTINRVARCTFTFLCKIYDIFIYWSDLYGPVLLTWRNRPLQYIIPTMFCIYEKLAVMLVNIDCK